MDYRPKKICQIIAIFSGMMLAICLLLWFNHVKANASVILHAERLSKIGSALRQYSTNFGGNYPTKEEWCDLLLKYGYIKQEWLSSSWAGDTMIYQTTDPNTKPSFSAEMTFLREYEDNQGLKHYSYIVRWSHFALNSRATPMSSGNVVLLFSTKGGWNQSGGIDIFSSDNYQDLGRQGGYVVFNNNKVEFIKPKDIDKLNWGSSK